METRRELVEDVILLGQQCAVHICGDVEEANKVKDCITAMAAIRTALKLGEQRNNERNELQVQFDRVRVVTAFFASVIKSGEPWTEVCEKKFRNVFPNIRSDIQKANEEALDDG